MFETSSIQLATPAVIVASLPHLLGFHPRESLVALWMSGSELVVVQRADLPASPDGMSPDLCDYLEAYLAPAERLDSDGVVLVCVTRRMSLAREIFALLLDRIAVHVRGGFIADGSKVHDAMKPVGWMWISTADRQNAAQVFASSSHSVAHAPARDRAQVVSEVQFDPTLASRASSPVPRPESVSELLQAMTRAPTRFMSDARLIAGLGVHVVGRDALMWWAARLDPENRRALLVSVLAALRATPPGRAAHLACLGGAIAWMCGDGVRANAAVDRCLLEDPEHVLGRMLEAAMVSAVPPSSFVEMVQQIHGHVVGLDEGCVDGSVRGGYSRE